MNKSQWENVPKYFDEVTHIELPAKLVRAARAEEIEYFNTLPVWDVVKTQECWDKTGSPPITTKWVDVNKGDQQEYDVRCRLVAREMGGAKNDEFYAPTPPLEAKRLLFSEAATNRRYGRQEKKLLFVDIRKAYFNAYVDRPTYVDLPFEMQRPGHCGRLIRCMYGTKSAATRWEDTYTKALGRLGFAQGRASPCCFTHMSRDLKVVVHGDDFTVLGRDEDLDYFQNGIQGEFEVKVRGRLGSGKNDDKCMRILNRIVRWTDAGLRVEADPRHVEILIKEMGLGEANAVKTPGVKDRDKGEHGEQPLDKAEASMYRSCVARANYLAQDRPDIAYAVKEACRDMANPTTSSWEKVKRVVRYLKGEPRVVYEYNWQNHEDISVYVDTDWAGCFKTRKSTSGGAIMRGGHLLKHWSSTQQTIALSSGEAELKGIVKGAAEGLGLQNIGRDLDIHYDIHVYTDASAAMGMVARKGIGRVRHIEVSELWIQDAVKNKVLTVNKVRGEDNPADILTKYIDQGKIHQHCHGMRLVPEIGRPESAPATSM